MNVCVICNKEIKNDSQFINGRWYHDDCIENLQEQNKTKDNIIKELEYRLKKLNIKIETKFIEYYDDEPLCTKKVVIKKQHIPAFDYYESI